MNFLPFRVYSRNCKHMNHVRPTVKTSLIALSAGLSAGLLAGSVAFAVGRAERYAVILDRPATCPAAQARKSSSPKAARNDESRHRFGTSLCSLGRPADRSESHQRKPASGECAIRGGDTRTGRATPSDTRCGACRQASSHEASPQPGSRPDERADGVGSLNGEPNAGAGVKIAVLDTGIDQNHAAFQENGLQYPAGFPKGDSGYTNRKVIAARSYVNMLVGTDPQFTRPDDLSPRDRVGHGTAVAMIAAGGREYRTGRDDHWSGAESVARQL